MAGERLVQIMQEAALGAIGNKGMADLLFGEVSQINPLKVKVDNRFELDMDFLIVPQSLTDYKVVLETEQETGTTSIASSHSHTYTKYTASKEYTFKNALKAGDKVALFRAVGGQRYYILDKVVTA